MMKKLTAILLALLMIFQVLPLTVLAEMADGDFQTVESNDIEGVETEEAFEVSFDEDDAEEQTQQPTGRGGKLLVQKNKYGKGTQKKNENGEKRTRRPGEKIGKLPKAKNKKHTYGWVDKKTKQYVTEDTIVTESMTLTPVGTNVESITLSSAGVTVEVPENSVPENTEFSAAPVSADEADEVESVVESVIGEAGEIRAMNLTFTDTNIDQEVEPSNPVEVTMSVAGMDTTSLVLLHIIDENNHEILDFTLNGETITFTANSFSVYAVIEENNQGDKARVDVNFYNGNTLLATMYVKNSDTADELKTILYDPGSGTLAGDEVFLGWIKNKPVYSSDDSDDWLDIDDVREEMEALQITEGMDPVNYYAVIGKIVTLTYLDEAGKATIKQTSAPN